MQRIRQSMKKLWQHCDEHCRIYDSLGFLRIQIKRNKGIKTSALISFTWSNRGAHTKNTAREVVMSLPHVTTDDVTLCRLQFTHSKPSTYTSPHNKKCQASEQIQSMEYCSKIKKYIAGTYKQGLHIIADSNSWVKPFLGLQKFIAPGLPNIW